ncbi:MAG: type domain [Acidobacteriota bacterium]|nr:type domain [Acidobacteriota bacterium]
MIQRALVILLLTGAIAACNRTPAPAAQKKAEAAEPARHLDRDANNLLNIASGAAVLSRTAELDLESSALHAIDGMSTTRWTSPPGDVNQTLIFSFGAPVRVEQVGISTTAPDTETPRNIRFSASSDARTWRDVTVLEPKGEGNNGTFMVKVEPFDANFLRVETVEPSEKYGHLMSVHALGSEIYPAELKSFDGCWVINGQPAKLTQRGARITGVILPLHKGDPLTVIDGGTDGRVARLMWIRGPQWGFAAATLTADSRVLSALTFHQNPLTGYAGRAWFGERCESKLEIETAPPVHFLNRSGQWTMSGLAFDDREQLIPALSTSTLDELVNLIKLAPEQRFRILSHEFRYGRDENRQRTVTRIASLRAALDARGIDWSRVEMVPSGDEWQVAEPVFAVQRLLWSRVDLQLQ